MTRITSDNRKRTAYTPPSQALLCACMMCATALAGFHCGRDRSPDAADAPKGQQARPGHVHTAPRGGALVELGDHFASIEFVLDRTEGTLTAYMLDAHAEHPVRLDAPAIHLDVTVRAREDGQEPASPESSVVTRTFALAAMPNALTGETVGDTSQFGVTSEELKGVLRFRGKIPRIEVRGATFENVAFSYPGGAE